MTPFKLVSSETSLTGDTLDIVFEAQADGVKVVKTYTLHKGRYDIDVKHDIYNLGTEPITPSLYLQLRSEEHTSELQSLMRISYAVFCLKNKKNTPIHKTTNLNLSLNIQ